MRRLICLLSVLILCLALACPAFASTFVPSITYKDGPTASEAEIRTENGEGEATAEEEVDSCLVITSILAAEEKTTDITQDERDLLLEIYEKLENGTMEPPLDPEKYVIRELVDISFAQNNCVLPEHWHEEGIKRPDTAVTLTLDLGVDKDTVVRAMVYVGDVWVEVKDLVNNGDGTVTGVFEDLGPVAFLVEIEDQQAPQSLATLDNETDKGLPVWAIAAGGALVLVSAAALIIRKKAK